MRLVVSLRLFSDYDIPLYYERFFRAIFFIFFFLIPYDVAIASASQSVNARTDNAHPYIYIGDVAEEFRLSNNVSSLVDSGHVSLYLHANAMFRLIHSGDEKYRRDIILWSQTTDGISGFTIPSFLLNNTGWDKINAWLLDQLYQTWNTRENRNIFLSSMAEIGPKYPISLPTLNLFKGHLPSEVNINLIPKGQWHYGKKRYGHYYTNKDYQFAIKLIDSAIRSGAYNVAIYITPNGFSKHEIDQYGDALNFKSPFWQYARKIALYGGAIAIDSPPTFALKMGDAYISDVASEIKWGVRHGLRVTLSLAPENGTHYDHHYDENTRKLLAILQSKGAIPNSYVVQAYCDCMTVNKAMGDGVPNSLNSVAQILLKEPVSPLGKTAPLAKGGRAQAYDLDL